MIALLTLLFAGGSALADPTVTPKKACTRVVASTTSYRELHLVGVRQRGHTRELVLIGGATGYVVSPGECAGRERISFDQLRASPQPIGDFEPLPPHDS
jgi:hypothetical protein